MMAEEVQTSGGVVTSTLLISCSLGHVLFDSCAFFYFIPSVLVLSVLLVVMIYLSSGTLEPKTIILCLVERVGCVPR